MAKTVTTISKSVSDEHFDQLRNEFNNAVEDISNSVENLKSLNTKISHKFDLNEETILHIQEEQTALMALKESVNKMLSSLQA